MKANYTHRKPLKSLNRKQKRAGCLPTERERAIIMPISLETAQKLASKQMKGLDLFEIRETDTFWYFEYGKMVDNILVPGVPAVSVSKNDGAIDYITVPPLENLDLLNNAKLIKSYI